MESSTVSNALSGLVAQYDSDEEPDSTAELNKGVESFFEEIDKLSLPKVKCDNTFSSEKKKFKLTGNPNEWNECVDSSTGYTYYWNIKTNDVSWVLPPDLKISGPSIKKSKMEVASQIRSKETHIDIAKQSMLNPENTHEPEKSADVSKVPSNKSFEDLIKDIENEKPPDHKEKAAIAVGKSGEVSVTKCDVAASEDHPVATGIMLLSNYSNTDSDEEIEEPSSSETKLEGYLNKETKVGKSLSVNESICDVSQVEPQKLTGTNDLAIESVGLLKHVQDEIVEDSKLPKLEAKSTKLTEYKNKINFVKGDVMVLSETCNKKTGELHKFKKNEPSVGKKAEDFEQQEKCSSTSETASRLSHLSEEILGKLEFLVDDIADIQPFKVLHIEAKVLHKAWSDKALKDSYYSDWLEDCIRSINTYEREAVSEGWSCHWDREYKRYFYCNKTLGLSQWSFPSKGEAGDEERYCLTGVAPPPPPMSDDTNSDMETETTDEDKRDSVTQALTSFYEDLASLPEFPTEKEKDTPSAEQDSTSNTTKPESVKKRKRTKLSSGLGLKKKGVPDLVAKWQKVQKQLSK